MTMTKQLLKDIELFIKRHGITEPTFGRRAAGNSNLLRTLRAGGSVTLPTYEQILEFMKGYGK